MFAGMCYIGNLDRNSLMYFVIIPLTLYLLIGSVALFLGLCYLFKILRMMKNQNIVQAGSLEKLIIKIGFFSVFYAFPTACVLAANFYQYHNLQHWKRDAQNTPCLQTALQSFNYVPNTKHVRPQENMFQSWRLYDKNTEYNPEFKRSTDFDQNLYNPDLYGNPTEVSKSSFRRDDFNSNTSNDVNCPLRESIAFYLIYFCKIFMSLLPGMMSIIWIISAKTFDSWMNFFRQCCNRLVSNFFKTQQNFKNITNLLCPMVV